MREKFDLAEPLPTNYSFAQLRVLIHPPEKAALSTGAGVR